MLAKYVGRGYAGFINGKTYKIRYEYTAGMIFISALNGELLIAYDSIEFARKEWKVI